MTALGIIVAVVTVSACSQHLYFYEASLSNIAPGWSKEQFLEYWSDAVRSEADKHFNATFDQPILRAAKRKPDGGVVEVFTINLVTSGTRVAVPYWFVFDDGALQQWGRPEDWAEVSARYDINFNPNPGVGQ